MATKTEYFSGECRWAKVFKPDEKFGKYSIEVKVDDLSKFKGLGVKGKDKEGWVTFRRDPEAMVYKDKQKITAGGPDIVDADGKPFTDHIGNGSTVTCKIDVYDYDSPKFGKGKGMRLVSVRVDKHVPWVKEEGANGESPPQTAAVPPSSPGGAVSTAPKPRIPF